MTAEVHGSCRDRAKVRWALAVCKGPVEGDLEVLRKEEMDLAFDLFPRHTFVSDLGGFFWSFLIPLIPSLSAPKSRIVMFSSYFQAKGACALS